MKWWVAAILGGVVTWMLCAVVHDVQAAVLVHDEQILLCDRNILYHQAEKLSEAANENGTWTEGYDTNADRIIDIEVISYQKGFDENGLTVHDAFPFMWIVDVDYDLIYDYVYVDVGNAGRCDDIKLYQDLRDPKAPWPDSDFQHEGQL
jgi:hypothetical protein